MHLLNLIPEGSRLVVFDWDGTLMDSTGRIVSAMQQTARNLELDVPTELAVKGIIGLGLTECFEILFPKVTGHEALTEEYRYQYVEGDQTPSPLFVGVEKTLEQLKSSGYQLAVATGKARHGLDRVLRETGLKELFNYSIAADEAKSKPHPEMLNRLLSQAQLMPKQALMVGDTSFDLEMAQAAGVSSIGVSFGAHSVEKLRSYQPLAIIDNY